MDELGELRQRLDGLERSNRRWRLGATVAGLAVAGVMLVGAGGQRIVEAEDVRLVDAEGTLRGRLFMSEGEPMLALYATGGSKEGCVAVSAAKGGGRITLGRVGGEGGTFLSSSSTDGQGLLLQSDKGADDGVMFSVNAAGRTLVDVTDQGRAVLRHPRQ
jgi:hypothetical protein